MKDSPANVFYCNFPEKEKKKSSSKIHHLNYDHHIDPNRNIEINLPDFIRSIYHLPDRMLDLLEIASYVYCADRLVDRGAKNAVEYHSWSRDFSFHIKVREYEFWKRPEVSQYLNEALCFMSGDGSYLFKFYPGRSTMPTSIFDKEEFQLPENKNTSVMLFSGGLDSLAGAVENLTRESGSDICLVSHRSQNKIKRTQDSLVEALKYKFSNRVNHYKFNCNFAGMNTIEETQRTRSFLYCSIAFAISFTLGAKKFYVYENGITGINFQKRRDMQNARASRTTHPKTLKLLEAFYSLLSDEVVKIENPFLFKTKTEVIELLSKMGQADLISSSVSCGRGKLTFSNGTHCGECSQCIDRRLSTYACSLESMDIECLYSEDFIRTPIKNPSTLITLMEYIRQALKFQQYTITSFYEEKITDLLELVDFIEGYDETGLVHELFDLIKRHGQQIENALARIRKEFDKPFESVQENSLLALLNQKTYLHELKSYDCFITELHNIKAGNKDAKKYEILIEKILTTLFTPSLCDPHPQVLTVDGRECIDLTFQNNANTGFWNDIKQSHGNMIVIFELKNMEELSNTEVDQVSSRLNEVKGMLGFLVCRNYSEKDTERCYRKLQKKEFIILIRDTDLEQMLNMLTVSFDPTDHIRTLYRNFIEKM